ncbi:MAG: cupin domain-containing protein [Microcoleus sp.]
MAERKFDPNQLTFDEGLNRIERASETVRIKLERRILTSKDEDVAKLTDALKVNNIPDGFQKWQLPVYLEAPSQLFISTAAPNSKVPKHAHRDGDGIRFIISGSVIYNGQELTAGDWMFIPAGHAYSLDVGKFGATMGYCYCCSCAGFELGIDGDVVNPAPFIPA